MKCWRTVFFHQYVVLTAVVGACGCEPREWSLGENRPITEDPADAEIGPDSFGDVVELAELTSDTNQDDPSLTRDLLEIYFCSKRETGVGGEDVWVAKRSSIDDTFSEPELVEGPNSEMRETASAISPDGLTLWFASDRASENEGKLDVWRSERTSRASPFDEPVHLGELSSADDDLPRVPAQNGDFLPLIRRSEAMDNDIFLAPRQSDGSYADPEPLLGINTASSESAPTFSANGLVLIFVSDVDDDDGDLYVASRSSTATPFGTPRALTSLNTADEESDPWLSDDGRLLVFVSHRDGEARIYRATRP